MLLQLHINYYTSLGFNHFQSYFVEILIKSIKCSLQIQFFLTLCDSAFHTITLTWYTHQIF